MLRRPPQSFFVPLPSDDGAARLDLVDGSVGAVARKIRRDGLANFEPSTVATLLTLWEMSDDLVFYDVGANIGLYASMCALMFDGTVVAFEPTPDTAAIARAVFERNGVDVNLHEVAVGVESGSADLLLSATSDASNSLVPGFKRTVGTVTVPVVSLDDHVAAGAPPPTVMKADVETFEPSVLRGARDTIALHRPYMVVEVLHRRGHDHGPDLEAVVDGLDYHYFRLGPDPQWNRRPHIVGRRKAGYRDWLLAPRRLPSDFGDRFARWRDRLATCTAERNVQARVRRG